MLWKRRRHDGTFEHKPVGTLPYAEPPRCGLYRAAVTDSPPASATSSAALQRLHKAVAAELRQGPTQSASERSPFDCLSVSSLVERLGTATHNGVSLTCTSRTVSTTVRFLYEIDNDFIIASSEATRDRRKTVAFFFPFSECGPAVESFRVSINDVPLLGELVRMRRSDGRLIPSLTNYRSAFLGETSDMSDDKEDEGPNNEEEGRNGDEKGASATSAIKPTQHSEKLLYYYVVPDIQLTMYLPMRPDSCDAGSNVKDSHNTSAGGARGAGKKENRTNATPFHVEVSWRCKNTVGDIVDPRDGHMNLAYSLYCSPGYPDYVSLLVKLNPTQRIRVIHSPNCRAGTVLNARIKGSIARVHVATVLGDSLRRYRLPGDYLFAFQVFVGETTWVEEEVSRWGATALVLVAAYLVWFFLTKDLVL